MEYYRSFIADSLLKDNRKCSPDYHELVKIVGNAAATVCRKHKKAEGRRKEWFENAWSTLQPGLQKKARLRIKWLKSQKAEVFETYQAQQNKMVG